MSIWYYLNGIEILVGTSTLINPWSTLDDNTDDNDYNGQQQHKNFRTTNLLIFAQRRWSLSLIGFGFVSIAVVASPISDSTFAKQMIGYGWLLYHVGIVSLYLFTTTTTSTPKPKISMTKNEKRSKKWKLAVLFHGIMSLGLGHHLLLSSF